MFTWTIDGAPTSSKNLPRVTKFHKVQRTPWSSLYPDKPSIHTMKSIQSQKAQKRSLQWAKPLNCGGNKSIKGCIRNIQGKSCLMVFPGYTLKPI